MAAYAALVSLINITEQIQNHPRISFAFDAKQIDSLRRKICFLLDFIEANSYVGKAAKADLESQITSAAYEAEDAIESHVVDQIQYESAAAAASGGGNITPLLDLRTLLEQMDCIKEKVHTYEKSNDGLIQLELQEEHVKEKVGPNDVQANTSSMQTADHSTMIGFDDELLKLMEVLVGRESSRQIIPIDGMGGIGKTTLARNTYENPTIVNHFDIQAWVTVSQTYNAKAILVQLLSSCKNISSDRHDTYTEDYQLGEELHKILSGRRYLIVLDDVWSVEAWEKIMFFFPDNNNRSRIVVTTRLSSMATYFGSSCLSLDLLDEEKSWNLFREKAFAQRGRTSLPKLEKIGKEIARKCKGLPLTISVIGGLLGKSSMTQEYWETVAEDINLILKSGDDEHCLNVLALSYSHLPAHLKPCFLYMGVFPEDHEIHVSRLVKLWVAEGFLRPNETQSLEEIARSYIIDLVGRNLILARQWGAASGKLKTCSIHDLLRDLCLRISEKEKFLHAINNPTNIPGDITRDRRLAFYGYLHEHLDAFQSESLVRSLILEYVLQTSLKCRLLRVLDAEDTKYPEISCPQVNLRYLVIRSLPARNIFSPIFMLWWNLQTLICTMDIFFPPSDIWEMSQLRHVKCGLIFLPDPGSDRQHGFVLQNLQTLKTVMNMRLTEELCRRIPNIRRLGLAYDDEFQGDYYLGNLCQFDKLQSLSLEFTSVQNRDDLFRNGKLPSSIQRLIIRKCELGWDDLAIIGSLPNLQVLHLHYGSVVGSEWNPIEGQFLTLKYLKIYTCDTLINWNADNFHFPVLEKLYFDSISELEEIPLGIGEIPTLRLIHLVRCSESSAISALQILEEQESQGIEDLQVRLKFLDEKEMKSFKEKVEPLSNNVKLEFYGL